MIRPEMDPMIYRSQPQTVEKVPVAEVEERIRNLVDGGHRDDAKLKLLQEIWTAIENQFTNSTHEGVVEKLIQSFLILFCNTSPQFISENNTQQLRKLMLEIILRLSNVEAVKSVSKDVIRQMLRLVAIENEENAVLAMKIVTDQGRTAGKMVYSGEVSQIMHTFKNMLIDLTNSGRSIDMFLNRESKVPPPTSSDEQLIGEYLKTCYYSQPVLLNGCDPAPLKFNMIPSAHQSIKVLLEVPYLVVFFYQHFKTSVQTEALDFMRLGLHFLNVTVPKDVSLGINQSLTDDFVCAQAKFLSFVNIMAKIPAFMDMIVQNGDLLVTGAMQMLERCPPDLVSVRREVLLALKFFSSGEMKTKFFPMLPRLISEHVVLGTGFTAIDHLRVFMYQMLADLLHHMRNNIDFEMITHVTFVFCRTLHDPTNTSQVQIMSARLLNSLAESLTKMDAHDSTRDLLVEILEAHVSKLKILAVYHMPILFQLHGQDIDYDYKSYERDGERPGTNIPKETIKGVPKRRTRRLSIDSVEELEFVEPVSAEGEREKLPPPTKEGKKTSPQKLLQDMTTVNGPPLPLVEARNLVKYIMHTCKFVTGQLRHARPATEMYHCARERDLFERLLRYGVMCMDVFVLPVSRNQPQTAAQARTKDEKDTLESLANVFTAIDHAVFREIFEKYMDFLIERIYNRNYPLQLMVNTFLVRNEVPFFASTMLSFLMSRMKLLEVTNDKTTLYVKLFKIIFSAIGANTSGLHSDKMLTSYLPEVLKQSTVLAMTAKEPLNYFLLLRSLFRSIGGGAQDILYGKFLQLLPNLLQFLNKLTSSQHRIQMRELFVELCLTVPVRLSSLLPYLPLLMDPLVCAMYGSPSIVTQGLRTLELCVDNLQPEYLLENMMPVRGALMQGLYRVVQKAPDSVSMTSAFRILGKFGGANRKLLNQPQILNVVAKGYFQSYFNMEFSRNGQLGAHTLELPLSDLLRIATDQLRFPSDAIPNPSPTLQVKKWCAEIAKGVLLSGLGSAANAIPLSEHFPAQVKRLIRGFDANKRTTEVYVCKRENDRELFVSALLVLAYGIWNNDRVRNQYLRFYVKVLRQFALIGVLEFVGGNEWIHKADQELPLCLDSSVLIDAMVHCLSESSNCFAYAGQQTLRHINETMKVALPDIDLMPKVPLCRYMMEKIFKLCHGPAWVARAGAITALDCIIEFYPKKFIMAFVVEMVDCMVEVILGVVEEISSGASDTSVETMKRMMDTFFVPEESENHVHLATVYMAAFSKHYFHSNERVREFMLELIEHCATTSRLEPTLEKFMQRFKHFFEPELVRIISTAPTMSLTDAIGSFTAVHCYMSLCPDGYDFEKDLPSYQRYLSYLLDIAQTDTFTLNQRNAFKKCETCPSHFLPPFPITVHLDSMRAAALQCLVIAYDRMKRQYEASADEMAMDVDETEEAMIEILALRSPRITIEQVYESRETWRRIMTVLLRADTDLDATEIVDKLHPALLKVAPIPTNIIATFGATQIRMINRMNSDSMEVEEEQKVISFSDIAKFKQLVELNPKILGRNMAQNLTNQVVNWKIPEKYATTIGMNRDATDEEIAAYEAEKLRGVRDLDMIGYTVQMLAGCSMSTLTDSMVIDIAKFAAHFEYAYSQDVLVNWIDDVGTVLSKSPKEFWKFFMTRESVHDPARRSLVRRVLLYKQCEPLREEFMENPEYFLNLLDMEMERDMWKGENERDTWDRDMYALSIVDRISRCYPQWLVSPLSPIPKLQELFNLHDFKQRYVVRAEKRFDKKDGDDVKEIEVQNMTEHKYKVPKLIINIFLRYLRLNIHDYQLFFDVTTVFIGNFITDFSFVREYLETEVIPVMPLAWRRQIFIQIMIEFETDAARAVTDLRVVKALQYLVIPSLQWAFERYDTDEIVGTAPIDDSEVSLDADSSVNMDNLVGRIVPIIETHRQKLSDGMVIAFYQLCTLFVQHASEHIHNNNCKKQGGRLRVFMLFAWPCLTPANRQDPTMTYAGFYFLSNIINRFTINRKIVLQVFNALTTTYHQDNRDNIRRAIDLLTPAVKSRMEDGLTQIMNNVKKVLIEECHTLQHVQHIFQMVVRNYRVYYHTRHELLLPLLNAVQRALIMPNSVMENWQTRRHAIEICEMVIKWELFGMLRFDHIITDEEADVVEKKLEKLRTAAADPMEVDEGRAHLQDIHRVIAKEHVDTVVNMLMRFCMTFHQSTNNSATQAAQAAELVKKSQLLLRVCLRGCVWGEFVHIRTSMIDKHVAIPSDIRNDHPASLITCQNAYYTLDMLSTVILALPKTNMMALIRPLQRSLCCPFINGHQQIDSPLGKSYKITRLMTHIIGRLMERTNTSSHGLDELESLNQFLLKYVNDQFSAFLKSNSVQVLHFVSGFSLLRTICTHEPTYIDKFINTFVTVFDRTAKEHLSYLTTDSMLTMRMRIVDVAELVCVCMELLRPRVEFIQMELKRAIASIVQELVLRSNVDKVLQTAVKLLGSMISLQDLEFTVNIVLPNLVRVQKVIVHKFNNSKDLIAEFLVVILTVFNHADYRNSEFGKRLWEGFFWGLKSNDPQTRENFAVVWEMTWPRESTMDMIQRMKHILQNQNWSKFKSTFWLKFVLWGALRTVARRERDKQKKVLLVRCASLWKTIEHSAKLKNAPPVTPEELKDVEPEPGLVQDDRKDPIPSLNVLLRDQQELMEEAHRYDFADNLDTVSQLLFALSADNGIANRMWISIFKSFWASLTPIEEVEFSSLVVPFISSGCHNNYQSGGGDSVLAVWLEAVGDVVTIPSRYIEFIAMKHDCWHTGIRLLENSIWTIPKQLNNGLLKEMKVAPILVSDIDTLESLGSLYNEIDEFDQFAAIWERRSVYPDTMRAMSLMQLGDMEGAANTLERTMNTSFDQLTNNMNRDFLAAAGFIPTNDRHVSPIIDKEYDHWIEMYVQSCSELLQWQTVADVCNSKDMQNVRGLILAASHMPDWAVVEECRNQIRGCIPPDFLREYHLYNLMCTVMRINHHDDPTISSRDACNKALQECIEAHISRWRALPSVVTYAHVKLLQSMNLIREIDESTDIRLALLENQKPVDGALMTDMKTLMKVFRNRTATIGDKMTFVSAWYDWRNQVHGMMLQRFDYWDKQGTNGTQSIVPIHSLAQAQLSVAKHAKNLGFHNLAKDLLNKLAGLTAIPMMDAQDKVCTYGKTLRDMAMNTSNENVRNELLYEAVEVLEDVRIDDLQKDQVATLLYHRASVHSALDQARNADLTFSAAAQLIDFSGPVNATGMKLMKNWGHHLNKRFFATMVTKDTGNSYGRQALAAYFVAARVDSDIKARKSIAKILWIAKHLNVCGSTEALNRVIRTQLHSLNLFNWLYWLPQLVTEVKHKPSSNFVLILVRMAAAYPLQTFFHIREAASVEQLDNVLREDYTDEEMSMDIADDVAFAGDEPFARALKICLKYRPTDIRVFHRILKELDQMDELWVERHLRYAIALKDKLFEDFSEQMDAHFNEMNFSDGVKKLAAEWKKRLDEDLKYYEENCELDYMLIREKNKLVVTKGFMGDTPSGLMFEKELSQVFTDPPELEDELYFVRHMTRLINEQIDLTNERPQVFVRSVLHWMKIMRFRLDLLPKRLPMNRSSPFLASFSHRTGCIEMPYDLLNVLRAKSHNLMANNQTGQYISMLSRFEPNFELVVKGGQVMRKIYVRGQTGKSAAFYLKKTVHEEPFNRVPQLFKHLDYILQTDHESARRHLHAPMLLQMRVGKHSMLYEIASVQPYAMPADVTRNYPASRVDVVHPYDVLDDNFVNYTADHMVCHFFDQFSRNAHSIGQPLPPMGEPPRDPPRLTEAYHIKSRIFDDCRDFTRDMVPFRLLYDYMVARYPDPVMYFSMRKQFLHSMAVLSMAEYHFNLTPLAPQQMVIAMSTGVLSNPWYRFEVAKGRALHDIQHIAHEVPFRLTPNLSILVGVAQDGDLQWSMAAAAKCFLKKEPEIVLRPLLWDEHANSLEDSDMVHVCHAVNSYSKNVSFKLKATSSSDAKMKKDDCVCLIGRAKDSDNLARMPPTYHAWF